jgi:hypothetical protein
VIIHSFGDSFGDLTFSQTQAEDDWRTSRPPVQSQVGGASGAFDYYDDAAYPTLPTTVVKRYTIVGTGYINAGTVKEQHKAALLSVGRSKLWAHLRDGTGVAYRRWAWAKCIDFFAVEVAGRQFTTYNIEAVFNLKEGLWYEQDNNVITRTVTGVFNAVAGGNHPALVSITARPLTGANIKRVRVQNTTNGIEVDWDDTAGTGIPLLDILELNSSAYSAIIDDLAGTLTDVYDKLILPSGQVLWMALDPGITNVMNLTISQTSGTFEVQLIYFDTYV